jgi:hypothetical protein
MRVSQQHLKEQMRASQELLKEEMLAKLHVDAHHERMMARMDSQLEKMEACLEKTKATGLEADSEKIKGPRWSMRRSLRKRPQWKRLEH